MEAIEAAGQWWLPEAPDEKVYGTLVVNEDGQATLSLYGSLESAFAGGESSTRGGQTVVTFTEASLEKRGLYPRILGQVQNKVFTLDDCLRVTRTSLAFGFATERISVREVFRGVQLDYQEPADFLSLIIGMEYLGRWTGRSGIREEMRFKTDEHGEVERWLNTSLSLELLPDLTCQSPSGGDVILRQLGTIAGDGYADKRITQDFTVELRRDVPTPLKDLLEEASALQSLVAIGTGRVPQFKDLSVKHPDVATKFKAGPRYSLIDYSAHWTAQTQPSQKPLNEDDIYFTLEDLGGMEAVERWLVVAAKERSTLGRVMTTRYSRGMLASDVLLNCVTALERYDKQRHDNANRLEKRLRRCCGLAADPFVALVGDTAKWSDAVKFARDDIAHHNFRVDDGLLGHHFLGESAYWLYVLCLLRDAGAPDVVFERIQTHSRFRHLARRLAELELLDTPGTASA